MINLLRIIGAIDQPPSSYQKFKCLIHGWKGDIAKQMRCPHCLRGTTQKCHTCLHIIEIIDPNSLFSLHYSNNKMLDQNNKFIIRKYSRKYNKIIYFCSLNCYLLYQNTKNKCVIA